MIEIFQNWNPKTDEKCSQGWDWFSLKVLNLYLQMIPIKHRMRSNSETPKISYFPKSGNSRGIHHQISDLGSQRLLHTNFTTPKVDSMEQWQLATAAKVPQPLASLWRRFGFALWYRLHDTGLHPTWRAVLLDSSKQLRPTMGEATRYALRRNTVCKI